MKKGFTLVEVLVVSVIVAVLSAGAIPAFTGYIDRTSSEVCENMAAMILKGVMVLAQDNPNIIPNTYTPATLSDQYDAFKVAVPPEYTIDIIIVDKDDITVIVQDDIYLGTATLETTNS